MSPAAIRTTIETRGYIADIKVFLRNETNSDTKNGKTTKDAISNTISTNRDGKRNTCGKKNIRGNAAFDLSSSSLPLRVIRPFHEQHTSRERICNF